MRALTSVPLLVLSLATLTAGKLWERGHSAVLTVDEKGPGYSIGFRNSETTIDTWLMSSNSGVHCDGVWRLTAPTSQPASNDVLTFNSSVSYKGTHPALGDFDALNRTWNIPGSAQFIETFIWFRDENAFAFQQTFPQGCANLALAPPPPMSDEQQQHLGNEFDGSVSPSTRFPSFVVNGSLANTLGYITWAGRFMHDDSSHGIGLSDYEGGSVGGPLLLFEPGEKTSNVMVLSAMDNFMSAITGVDAQSPSNSTSGQCVLEPHVDFEGNDLSPSCAQMTPNAEECCALCLANPACTCFSWLGNDTAPYTNLCCLKSSTAGRVPSTLHTSGVVQGRTDMNILASGIQGYIPSLPAGFSVSFILSTSKAGINGGMHKWGKTLQSLYNTTRLERDILSEKLGYWTDNGGYYYGGNNLNEDKAISLFQGLKKLGIPINYLQLDPFWYPADEGNASCALSWTPRPDLFPNGIKHLSDAIDLPVLLYSSYFCPEQASEYYDKPFMISREITGLSWASGHIGNVDAPYSEAFYREIMANYTPQGLIAFEVDFMDFNYLLFNDFITSLDNPRVWAKGMADAALSLDLPVQYCMGLSNWMLQALEFPAVTNARASEDNFPGGAHASGWVKGSRWQIGYTTLFLNAVALRPFFDVVWSEASCPGSPYSISRDNIALQMTVAALSAGPLGIGDGPGCTNTTLVMSTCMSDGTLLHTSRGATPIDMMYSPGNYTPAGQIWAAHSEWDATSSNGSEVVTALAWTVLAVDVTTPYTLTLDDLWPRPDPALSYVSADSTEAACKNGARAVACLVPLNASQALTVQTAGQIGVEHTFHVLTIVPVNPDPQGFTLLGEVGKIVRMSPNRIVNIVQGTTSLTVSLAGVAGESTTMRFMSGGGMASASIMDVHVAFPASGSATISCGHSTCKVL